MKVARLAFGTVLLSTVAFTGRCAWWQFVSLGPDGLREVHSPYKDEATCQAALKKVEEQMKKQFPKQYPLVGSCQEYTNQK